MNHYPIQYKPNNLHRVVKNNPVTRHNPLVNAYGSTDSNGNDCPSTLEQSYKIAFGLASAAALGVSYYQNKSIGWALLHGFIGPAYLVYYYMQQRRQ